jgi:hypothetical protein
MILGGGLKRPSPGLGCSALCKEVSDTGVGTDVHDALS